MFILALRGAFFQKVLQLVPLLNVVNLSSSLGINSGHKKPLDFNHERIVAIYCKLVALIGHKFIIRGG